MLSGGLQNFPAARKEKFQRVLEGLIPKAPFVCAGPLPVGKLIGQRLDGISETDVMGIQEIFRSTGDHDLWQLCFWKQGSLFYQIKQIILRFYYKIFPKNRFGFSQQAGIHLRKSSAQRFHIQAYGQSAQGRYQSSSGIR